jgi:hypothetical protein
MEKWEYLEVLVYGGAGAAPDSVQVNGQMVMRRQPPTNRVDVWSYMNHLGQEGWEMIAHTHLGGSYRVYNFKRLCG